MSLSQESQDELLAVSSIFLDISVLDPPKSILVNPNNDIQVRFTLSNDYPEKSVPSIEISAPSLSSEVKASLKSELATITEEKKGEQMLFDLITRVNDFVENLKTSENDRNQETKPSDKIQEFRAPKNERIPVPEIFGTDIVTDRKSVFQAHIGKINSKEEAMAMLAHLMENTKIARATHRIYAYRTFVTKNDKKLPLHDCEDDGETGAGAKVLNLLEMMEAENVMVVVTRWYGGIHLGPDRFKHILNLARTAIIESGFVVNEKTSRNKS